MRYFIAALAIIGMLAIDGCGKVHIPQMVQSTDSAGNVSIEINTERTYHGDELPAGVKPNDVAAIITLEGDTASEIAPGPGDPVPNDIVAAVAGAFKKKPSKSTRQDKQIIVTKTGRVIAGREAAGNIEKVQKVERSWKWLWWLIGVFAAVMGAAWAVDKFVKPISLITRWFRR